MRPRVRTSLRAGSPVRPVTRYITRAVCPLTLSVAMTLTIPGLLQA